MVNQVEMDMMQILQIGTCKKNTEHRTQNTEKNSLGSVIFALGSSFKGFTLIELIVVIFIISLTVALVMPSFWGRTEKTMLKTEARHISSALRYVYDEAVGKKQIYSFNVNLDDESWGFKSKNESRSFKIKGDVEITDVIVPSHGEISRGEILIEFGPMGPPEPIILHLKKGESEYTIIFNHINGRTKVLEGYEL